MYGETFLKKSEPLTDVQRTALVTMKDKAQPKGQVLMERIAVYLEYLGLDTSYQRTLPCDGKHFPIMLAFDSSIVPILGINAQVQGDRAIAMWLFDKNLVKKFLCDVAIMPRNCGEEAMVIKMHEFFADHVRPAPRVDKLSQPH